jgi:hypothetical protein
MRKHLTLFAVLPALASLQRHATPVGDGDVSLDVTLKRASARIGSI